MCNCNSLSTRCHRWATMMRYRSRPPGDGPRVSQHLFSNSDHDEHGSTTPVKQIPRRISPSLEPGSEDMVLKGRCSQIPRERPPTLSSLRRTSPFRTSLGTKKSGTKMNVQ
ncbi:hypothetical protein BC826DRAFT_343070 [Russula brevipes]|nr:hypothetical protein BC826DRAFT_343070 [Russula brevipes]